jgi:hypothetical protein
MATSTHFGHLSGDPNYVNDFLEITASPTLTGGLLFVGWVRVSPSSGIVYPYVHDNNIYTLDIFGGTTANDIWRNSWIHGEVNADAADSTGCLYSSNSEFYTSAGYYADYAHQVTPINAPQIFDWICVAWYVTFNSTQIVSSNYLRFGLAGSFINAVTDTVTIAELRTAIGNPSWSPGPINYMIVGGNQGSNGSSQDMEYCRIYNYSGTAPTLAQLDAIAEMSAPDTTSAFHTSLWSDWTFDWSGGACVMTDRSGNSHVPTLMAGGTLYAGTEGPALASASPDVLWSLYLSQRNTLSRM